MDGWMVYKKMDGMMDRGMGRWLDEGKNVWRAE